MCRRGNNPGLDRVARAFGIHGERLHGEPVYAGPEERRHQVVAVIAVVVRRVVLDRARDLPAATLVPAVSACSPLVTGVDAASRTLVPNWLLVEPAFTPQRERSPSGRSSPTVGCGHQPSRHSDSQIRRLTTPGLADRRSRQPVASSAQAGDCGFRRGRPGKNHFVFVAASTVAIVAIAAAIIVVALLVFYVLPRGGRRKRPPRT